jgi:uncharacterized protein (DUF697 family)
MGKLVKEWEYLLTWFVFWLCATIGGGIVGAIFGAIAGAILGLMGCETRVIKIVCAILGGVVALPVSYGFFRLFVAKMIVRKVSERLSKSAPEIEHQQGV